MKIKGCLTVLEQSFGWSAGLWTEDFHIPLYSEGRMLAMDHILAGGPEAISS